MMNAGIVYTDVPKQMFKSDTGSRRLIGIFWDGEPIVRNKILRH